MTQLGKFPPPEAGTIAVGKVGAPRPGRRLALDDVLADPDLLAGFDTITTDVFDTLLIRRPISERARLWRGERRFAVALRAEGHEIAPDLLLDVRLAAQRHAFRALDTGGVGEVRLGDVVARQMRLLGLPEALVAKRIEIELAVERESLRPNRRLAAFLHDRRRAGAHVVAVSDTTLESDALTGLLTHFLGDGLFDAVFASASAGATKRQGDLFARVVADTGARPERTLHIGDDARADGQVPRALGLTTVAVPRSRLAGLARKASGAGAELGRRWRRHRRLAGAGRAVSDDAQGFGRDVLGPIAAQFATQVWLYTDAAARTHPTALLFCARGGIGIGAVYEAVEAKLGLPQAAPRGTLLISRLVAARASVAARGPAALEELDREFHGTPGAEVAHILGGGDYGLPASWQAQFDGAEFYRDLDRPEAQALAADIERQAHLLGRHLDELGAGAERLILCDTGLYGSTQRSLGEAFPTRAIETIQIARANYKGHGEEHFGRVTGLMVERDRFTPIDRASAVLRYWQLIERLFEPALPSVRLLEETAAGRVTALGHERAYGDIGAGNPMLAGALDYVAGLPADGAGAQILTDAELAWLRFERAITRPTPPVIAAIGQGARSVDFGRGHSLDVLGKAGEGGVRAGLGRVRRSLWREGAIAQEFPRLRGPLHLALNAVHGLRGLALGRRG